MSRWFLQKRSLSNCTFFTLAPFFQRCLTASTFFCCADISSKKDYCMMHSSFLFICEEFFKFFICFCGSFCFHNSHTIHHSMNVSINSYVRSIVEMGEDDFCRFDTNTRESLYLSKTIGNLTIIVWEEFFCCFKDMSCFNTIIIHRTKYYFYFFWFDCEKICRSFNYFKKFFGWFIDSLVCHLSWKHDSNKELKGGFKIKFDSFFWINFIDGL